MCVWVIVRLAFRMWCHTGWPTSARQKEQNIWLWRANGRSPRLGGGWTNPIKERDEMYRQTVLYNWALSAIWLSFYMSHCKMVLIKSWEYNLNIGTDQIVWWIPSGHRLCDFKKEGKTHADLQHRLSCWLVSLYMWVVYRQKQWYHKNPPMSVKVKFNVSLQG